MGIVIISLLPLIVGCSLGGPAWVIMTLILLRGEHGVIKAAAFAAGATIVRLLQFVLFGYAFGVTLEMGGDEAFAFVRSTLLLVAGILLFISAIKTWSKGDDPDAPPPKWIEKLSRVSTVMAFGMALLMMMAAIKQWVFTLSAIAIIDAAHLGMTGSVLAYLFFILTAQWLMLTPIVGSVIAPTRSVRIVEEMLKWLERKNRVITIVVSLVFGTWFFTKGLNGLMAHGVPVPVAKTSTTKLEAPGTNLQTPGRIFSYPVADREGIGTAEYTEDTEKGR